MKAPIIGVIIARPNPKKRDMMGLWTHVVLGELLGLANTVDAAAAANANLMMIIPHGCDL